MNCKKCRVCDKPISQDDSGKRLCLPVIVADPATRTRHCWCVCDKCQADFIKSSAKALNELNRADN